MQNKKQRKKIGWTWSFNRMHPALKAAGITAISLFVTAMGIVGAWAWYAIITM